MRESGFSLVEVMVGGALLVGASLAAVKIFNDQKMSQRRIELDRILDAHMGTVKSNLAIKINCNSTMGIPAGASSAPRSSFPTTLTAIKVVVGAPTNPGTNLVSVGDYINDQRTHRLSNIRVINPNTTGMARLEMDFFAPQFNSTVRRNVFVPIKFTGDQGGSDSYECMDDKMGVDKTLQMEGCEALDALGKYEPDLQDCTVRDVKYDSSGNYHCPGLSVLAGVRPDGTVECVDAGSRLLNSDAIGPGSSGCNGQQVRLNIVNQRVVVECGP